jgi:threonyl-tRNA synthetase
MVTIGDKEQEKNTLAIRTREGKVKFEVKIDDFIKELKQEITKKQ